jgi:GTPase SAR1 family protein
MSKVIIIIGLPGSGKSTLLREIIKDTKFECFQDWTPSEISPNGEVLGTFRDDKRYDILLNYLKNSKDIILDSSNFCDHKFLCEAEYYLNLEHPNVEIERYYFENNPTNATANVLYRDAKNGGYWFRHEEKELYSGSHYIEEGPNLGRRYYEVIIEAINNLTKNYIIPSRYTPLKIPLVDKKYLQGWRALMRE